MKIARVVLNIVKGGVSLFDNFYWHFVPILRG